MRRTCVRVLLAIGVQLGAVLVIDAQSAAAAAADPASTAADPLAIGQRLYREGIRASGEILVGLGAAQTRLAGRDVACVACHRRSGFGTTEGRYAIRPITGAALTQEQSVAVRSPRVKARLGNSQRPPYTEALLARAIRSGLDSTGKPLDPIMPRYALSDDEAKALAAYLMSLSVQPSPGVDDEEIHFGTVIQPDASLERRRAMLDVMRAFVRDKNGNSRSQDRRKEAGTMQMDRAYRRWVLDVWELTGPVETWNTQLEEFYRRQPVFAFVGGLGDSTWRPVHDFAERHEIPSVFPLVNLPVVSGQNDYNLYFSRGVTLDAEVLAKFLRDKGQPGKVVQVYRPEGAGATAAAALRAALGESSSLADHGLAGEADPAFWQTVFAAKPAALVLWLGAADLAAMPPRPGEAPLPIYLSFNLLAGKRPERVLKASADVRLIYPSDMPPRHEARLLRNKLWLHNKGIALTDEATQMNALFAMTVASDALGHIADNFSRDYFVERIEHVVSQTPTPSLFEQVSLGPGQRFAAKGSNVFELAEAGKQPTKALSGWIVP